MLGQDLAFAAEQHLARLQNPRPVSENVSSAMGWGFPGGTLSITPLSSPLAEARSKTRNALGLGRGLLVSSTFEQPHEQAGPTWVLLCAVDGPSRSLKGELPGWGEFPPPGD